MAIFGTVDFAQSILPKNDKLEIVFNYLNEALESGSKINKRILKLKNDEFFKYDLTDEIFIIEQSYYTRSRNDTLFESHRKYIDFQCIVSGEEVIEVVNVNLLIPTMEYNIQDDYTLYEKIEKTSKLMLSIADIALLYPEDAHMPTLYLDDLQKIQIHKIVVKVPYELLC